MAFTTYLAQLAHPVRVMGLIMPVLAMAEAAGERIFEILVGLHYQAGEKIFIQAGGVEDIFDSANASVDVTLFMNMGLNF